MVTRTYCGQGPKFKELKELDPSKDHCFRVEGSDIIYCVASKEMQTALRLDEDDINYISRSVEQVLISSYLKINVINLTEFIAEKMNRDTLIVELDLAITVSER